MMIQLVNNDAYAQASGTMLDAWLTSSAPFRKAVESAKDHHGQDRADAEGADLDLEQGQAVPLHSGRPS
jgi:hypothetical protein